MIWRSSVDIRSERTACLVEPLSLWLNLGNSVVQFHDDKQEWVGGGETKIRREQPLLKVL